MNARVLLLATALLAGCVAAPPPPPAVRAFNDHLFAPPSSRISAADVFAVSPEMRRYVREDMAVVIRARGKQQGLMDVLYERGKLKLEYDTALTRNAAEAFAARAGNCLSLVIMTAAFAKEFDLPVKFQRVLVDDTWSRNGDIYFSIGHVNLAIGRSMSDNTIVSRGSTGMIVIDFLPPQDVRNARAVPIDEATIVAMYMNNRAVESLTLGNIDDAYWWAREAMLQDPAYLSSYNTLGAIYFRHKNSREAEHVLSYVLEREPSNVQVMSNLAPVLRDLGRVAEASTLTRRVEQLQPHPPFSFFDRGLAAMRAGDYAVAKENFAREVARAPYSSEFHFWLAVANLRLGDLGEAKKHMSDAVEASTSRGDHDLYAAKLAQIKAARTP